MNFVELNEVCEFLDNRRRPVTESERRPGSFPYYGANGQQGWIDGYIFDEPLILLAEDGGHFGSRVNPIAYKITGKTWVNNHAHVLKPRSNCDIDYLKHVLSFYDVTKYINGTTRPKLTKGEAEQIRIPFPDLTEQKKISDKLNSADRLRRVRRYALEMSNSFLPAVFVEMFGNPVRNTKEWQVESLGVLGDVATGGTPPSEKSGMFGGKIPFVTPGDLEIDTADSKRFLTDAGVKESVTVRAGSTLVCCIGATIGKTDKALIRCAFNQQINAVEWGKSVNDDFGFYLMRFFSKIVADRGQSTTLPILKKSSFEELILPVPPLTVQEKFADIVKRHERLHSTQVESLRQAEHLFQSLLHQAFSEN